MQLFIRILAAAFVAVASLTNAAAADSWRAVKTNRGHIAIYKATTLLTYNPYDFSWYLGFGVNLDETINKPSLKFTASDGSSVTYSLKPDLIQITPEPGRGISTVIFPIGPEGVELLQSQSSVTLKLNRTEYTASLSGSRAAISTVIKRTEHDQAEADDAQHAKAQAASDAAQAAASGGGNAWSFRGQKSTGTRAESYEASVIVDDDEMSLVYYPVDDAFFLRFTYNGTRSFGPEHSDRAEIFIRTREIDAGGRYDSDYVFKGATVAQPDSNPSMPQIILTRLTPEDIRALRSYDGNDIGAGYFLENDWTTYRLSGKGLWKSFVQLAVAVNRTDLLQ